MLIMIRTLFVGLQPTVIASRAPHLLLEQSVMTTKIRRIWNRGRASPVKTLLDLFRNKTNFVPEIQDNKLQFMGSIDGPDKGPSTILPVK